MRKIIIFIFIHLIFYNLESTELCKECSSNIGSSYRLERLDNTKSSQLISTAIGIIASNEIQSPNGSTLISGYMPVCVLPTIQDFNNVDTCKVNTLELYSGSYLTDEIIWNYNNSSTFTNFWYNKSEMPFVFNNQTDTTKISTNNIKLASLKGEIYSREVDFNVNIYPIPKINILGDTNTYCLGSTITLSAEDQNGGNNDENNYTWIYNWGTGDRVVTGRSLNLQTNNMTNLVTISLIIRNQYSNIVSCASSIVNFSLQSIAPRAQSKLIKDNNNLLNSAEYEFKTLKMNVSVDPLNADYATALNLCTPNEVSAEIVYYQKHINFVPKANTSIVKDFPLLNYNTLYINSQSIKDINNGILFEIEGYPLLGDLLESDINVRNIRFSGPTISNTTFNIQNVTDKLQFEVCEEGNSRLIFKKSSAYLYPNPNNGNEINIFIDDLTNEPINIEYQIIDSFGDRIIDTNNFIVYENSYKIILPKQLISGRYTMILKNENTTYYLPLTVIQ